MQSWKLHKKGNGTQIYLNRLCGYKPIKFHLYSDLIPGNSREKRWCYRLGSQLLRKQEYIWGLALKRKPSTKGGILFLNSDMRKKIFKLSNIY